VQIEVQIEDSNFSRFLTAYKVLAGFFFAMELNIHPFG